MCQSDTQLSKSLSWLLRHAAVKEGLSISSEGYIQVGELLHHKCFKGKYSICDVERVVNNNSKQRFKLRRNPLTNALEIKATQGHSIAQINETELTPILENKYKVVVHGTYMKYWPLIKEQGLSRVKRKHIHLAKGLLNDPSVISGLRKDINIYIFINIEKALADGLKFYESENGVILTEGNENGFLELKYISKVVETRTDPTAKPTTSNADPNMPALFKKPSPVTSQSSPSRNAKRSSAKRSSAKQSPRSGEQERNQSANNSKTTQAANGQAASSTADDVKSPDKSCKVEISGYPAFAKPRDLWKFFTSYGNPTLEQVGRKHSIISFSKKEEAKAAINDSMKVCMYGQFLTIKPYSSVEEYWKQGNKNNKNTVELIEPERLALSGSFEEQLGVLLAAVRLTQEEVGALAALYTDVERVLQPLWPGCQAMPFGSLTTGLGVKSSDADCFVNIPPPYRLAQSGFVGRARRVLQQYPHLFAEVIGIPRANTPIVKLLHVPTRTRCDLSFKTPLGALNSKLVSFLLHADARLVPLAVLAKYWAAAHHLSGTGRLSNYALTMLLLFYLQRRGVLPAVAALQADCAHRVMVDGWDSGFAPDYSRLPRPSTADQASVADLLGGFFAFYHTFDFDSLVVCPYLGRPVEKLAFLDHNLLPDGFDRYCKNVEENYASPLRVNVPMCVQDPFEQSHNVASAVTAKLARDIQAYFAFATEAYEKEKATGCVGFLRTILMEKPKSIRARSSPEYRVTFYSRQLDTISREDWRAAFRETVYTVFERILQLKLTPAGETEKTRNKREKERYLTSFDKPLWKRKQFSRLYESVRMGFVEKHARITEEVLNVEHSFAPVELQVNVSFCTSVRSVWVSIRLTDGDVDAFHAFGKYLLSTMPNLVIGTLHASGCMVVKESLKKMEAMGAVDSNVGNSDFDSDSAVDETKNVASSDSKQDEHTTSKEKSMANHSPTEIIDTKLKNSMEVDHGKGESSTDVVENTDAANSKDESSVSKPSMEDKKTTSNQQTELCAMEIENTEVKNYTGSNLATAEGVKGMEKTLSDL